MWSLRLALLGTLAGGLTATACDRPPRCYDGVCSAKETPATCPADCIAVPAAYEPAIPFYVQHQCAGVNAGATYTLASGQQRGTFALPGVFTATVTRVTVDEWELALTPLCDLTAVTFPFQPVAPHAPARARTRVYAPELGGWVERGEWPASQSGHTTGNTYPGPMFSPFVIVASDAWAQLVAAANWPPRAVEVLYYRNQGVALRYPGVVAPVVLRAIVHEVVPAAPTPTAPWQLAALRYKAWLDSHFVAARSPAWMEDGEGYVFADLQNQSAYDPEYKASQVDDTYPWLQVWGQMSNYAGAASAAIPPRAPGEPFGCCLLLHPMHPRYLSPLPHPITGITPEALPNVAHRLTRRGYHVGYYSRPEGPVLYAPTTIAALSSWFTLQRDAYGANAYYVDTLGNSDYGDLPKVSAMFGAQLPADLLIEYFKDVYPAASLMSGSVAGRQPYNGGPGVDPGTCDTCSFLPLSRVVMGNRIGYFGPNNGEHGHHGPNNACWGERQMFLHGLKAEVDRQNDCLRRIARARKTATWWKRRPVYLHTAGLSNIPAGVEARRFRANDGADLVAIDNPARLAQAALSVDGRSFSIPTSSISVLDIAAP